MDDLASNCVCFAINLIPCVTGEFEKFALSNTGARNCLESFRPAFIRGKTQEILHLYFHVDREKYYFQKEFDAKY